MSCIFLLSIYLNFMIISGLEDDEEEIVSAVWAGFHGYYNLTDLVWLLGMVARCQTPDVTKILQMLQNVTSEIIPWNC